MRTFLGMLQLLKRAWKAFKLLLFLVVVALVIHQESPPPGTVETQINRMIVGQTFDYLGWGVEALYAKGEQISIPVQNYLPDPVHKDLVLRYISLVRQADEQTRKIAEIYGDPQACPAATAVPWKRSQRICDPKAASASQRAEYRRLRAELDQMQSVVEGIIEDQLSAVLAEQGFAIGGQVVPPVKFRFTPLPQQLIISPRDEIRRMHSFSLEAGFSVDRAGALEDEIDRRLDVSSLVVPLGGIGIYPTMLLESDSLEWIVGVVAHEWAHNWLTMFPLGWNYETSPELRTMNETAASIVEKEIGPLVLACFYPEMVHPPEPAVTSSPDAANAPADSEPEQRFDFRKEMHITRVETDRLLKEAKIAEAESYMEARRQVFWEQGYHIRKLNQAYFAFYGAYADAPGASGEDPVGPAVVRLRDQSSSLKAFLLRLAPMTSFETLKRALD